MPPFITRRHFFINLAFVPLLFATQQDGFGCHLTGLEINQFLESKGNDIGVVDRGKDVMKEANVFRVAGKGLGFCGIDIPRNDEHFEVPERAERMFAFQ